MTPAEVVGIGLLGGVGAIARFALDGNIGQRVSRGFPYGTLAVNLLGSLTLGALVGATLGGAASQLFETGLIGGFTTFSTWMLESHRLGEARRGRLGLANVALSLVLGVGAAWAGRRLGAAL